MIYAKAIRQQQDIKSKKQHTTGIMKFGTVIKDLMYVIHVHQSCLNTQIMQNIYYIKEKKND